MVPDSGLLTAGSTHRGVGMENQSRMLAQRVEPDLWPLFLCDVDLDGIAGRTRRPALQAAMLLRCGGSTSPVSAFMPKPGSAISTFADGSAALTAAANSGQGFDVTPIISWNLS